MASKQEQTFSVRLLVDNEKNHVVMAEANGDFIDTLFSFLTLPLGKIIQLVSKNQQHDQPVEVGCINNLYDSVKNSSDDEFFWNPVCKKMLLHPRNPYEALCQKLKLNVDDTERTMYFRCKSKCRDPYRLLSTFAGARCRRCGKEMDKKMELIEDPSEETHEDGVFVKRGAIYLIFDDLRLIQNSPTNFAKELAQQGHESFDKLTEMTRDVGLKEILGLLKQALTSNSPLSDVFLANRGTCNFSPKIGPKYYAYSDASIYLKVTVRKSNKKIIYAEARGDFVDFLFSFLTAPLGSILKILDGHFSLGCMTNLYESFDTLDSSWFISRTPLQDPRVEHQFGVRMQPLGFYEQETPIYWHGTVAQRNNTCCVDRNDVISKKSNLVSNPDRMSLLDPRSPDGKSSEGYVRKPSLFVVWDDLRVTPLANTSSISLMQKLNVPLGDLEELELDIGWEEALNLLGASLTSKAALTEGLFDFLGLENPNPDGKA